MDLQCTLLIALIGAFCYTVDAGRIRRDGRWTGGLDTDLRNGRGTVTGNIGYKNGGFSANGHYTETFGRGQDSWGASAGYNQGGFTSGVEYSGTRGYESVSGHVGYQRGNFNVRGTGFRDSTGNWGAGATLGYRFRRSLDTETEDKPSFYLRVEADPCQFILYDRNGDGVITIEEVEEVFPDKNLADDLFQRLDTEEKGELSVKEFEAAIASGAIVGCVAATA